MVLYDAYHAWKHSVIAVVNFALQRRTELVRADEGVPLSNYLFIQ